MTDIPPKITFGPGRGAPWMHYPQLDPAPQVDTQKTPVVPAPVVKPPKPTVPLSRRVPEPPE
jgi:hypothetical protein